MSAVRTASTLSADDGRTSLTSRLRVLLLAMEYPAFARCICTLLEALGYEDARPAGRAEWKGYNRPGGGGYDLEAMIPGGLAPRRMVAQIKQFDGLTVHQRNVDELRGACLRAGAVEALLLTTSAFSEVVRKAALSPNPAGGLIAPVRLIDGKELLALMIRQRIGVRARGLDRQERGRLEINKLEIDEAFFKNIAAPKKIAAPATCAPSTVMSSQHERPTLPGWRVTVQVFSPSFPRSGRGGKTKWNNREADTERNIDMKGED